MKSFSIFIALLLAGLIVTNAQNQRKLVQQTVFSQEMYKNWEVNEVKEVEGVKVMRASGENGIDDRTNVLFNPENFQLAIFYDRNDENLAQPQNFLVKIKDPITRDILYQYQLTKAPVYYKWDIWYNYEEIELPLEANSLIVEVADDGLGKYFEFYVYDISPGDQPQQLYTKETK